MDSAVEAARDAFLAVFADARAVRKSTLVRPEVDAAKYNRRVEASLRATSMLVEAVGADEAHPVAHAIHRKLSRVFVLGSRVSMAWFKAQQAAVWLRSHEFEETVELWKALSKLPGEYAGEILG